MAPCWKTLLADSYDGRIDHVYPIPCYHQAIAHLPLVLKIYSSERDDILRALQRVVAGKGAGPPRTDTIVGPHVASGVGSLPIPLLILGSVAALLVFAGVAGAVWRRFRPSSGS
jgi:hypothetical protein